MLLFKCVQYCTLYGPHIHMCPLKTTGINIELFPLYFYYYSSNNKNNSNSWISCCIWRLCHAATGLGSLVPVKGKSYCYSIKDIFLDTCVHLTLGQQLVGVIFEPYSILFDDDGFALYILVVLNGQSGLITTQLKTCYLLKTFFFFSDHIPEDMRDPFYTDQYEQEHIKPPVIRLLLSSELYCRVCGLILKGDQAASLQSHLSVIQALSRKGIYVMEGDDTPVTDGDLLCQPVKMVRVEFSCIVWLLFYLIYLI